MQVFTITCPECGTVVAANVLERNRVMKCPRTGCEAVVRFEDLSAAAREHVVEHRDRYRI